MSPASIALLLAPSLTLTQVQLRWELLNVGAGVLLLVIGLGAISLYFFRSNSRDLTLIYFGLFTTLYGFRLLSERDSIRATLDFSLQVWRRLDWGISAVIILPFGLFVYQLVGEELRKLFRWLLWAQGIAAVLEIAAGIFGVKLHQLAYANNVVVLSTFAITGIFVAIVWVRTTRTYVFTREVRVFLIGLLIWAAFIFENNLASLGIVRGVEHRVEFIGFLIFVCCLGYVTARRAFATEERLFAINAELGVARQIQSATLPREVPKLSGLTIAERYVPMSEVAGDFYDFIVDGPMRLGVLIADVSGHGVPAALIASMLQVAFAGQSHHASDPARMLAELNRSLVGKFEEHYATGAYVFIDLEKSLLRYAGAGHPPVMLASRSAKTVRLIEENGTVLGMIPDAPYTAIEVRLQPGDRVLLYTDGVFEAMNAAQVEYSKPRLEKFLAANTDLSADKFANALLDDVNVWSDDPNGRSQDDDITLVVLDIDTPNQAPV
jgi:sulfur transfer complex TusBCD TusB component (DsrH family)